MGQFTLTPSEQEIQAFLKQYKKYLSSSKNPYIRYFFRLEQATASVYTSGKLLLQGEEADKYALFFKETADITQPPQKITYQAMIGTDEVGNGSYFGGLAVVASFVTKEQEDFLRKLGVGDSKKLTTKPCSCHPRSTTKSLLRVTMLSQSRLPFTTKPSISC